MGLIIKNITTEEKRFRDTHIGQWIVLGPGESALTKGNAPDDLEDTFEVEQETEKTQESDT